MMAGMKTLSLRNPVAPSEAAASAPQVGWPATPRGAVLRELGTPTPVGWIPAAGPVRLPAQHSQGVPEAADGARDTGPNPRRADPRGPSAERADVSRETERGADRNVAVAETESRADSADVSRAAHTTDASRPTHTTGVLHAADAGDVSRETARPVEQAQDAPPPRVPTLPRPGQTRVLTVANQKGGVGKTTTAVNMAAALSQSGLRVLVVDMDPQGNASTALGIPHGGDAAGIYDVLIDGTALAEVVRESPTLPGLWCAPATIDLAGAEIELVPMVAREGRLRKAVRTFLRDEERAGARYDYVFIDCPPSLGLLTINSFVAASEVLIPIQCEYYALEGLSQLLSNIELIKEHLNPELEVSHILLTMYDGRTRLSSQVADEVRSHFSRTVLRTSIPRSVRISEAPSHGETVITYDPISSGALCYLEAAKEVARAARAGEEGSTDE